MKAKAELLLYMLLWTAQSLTRPTWRNANESFEGWSYSNGFLKEIHRLEAKQYIEQRRAGLDRRLVRLTEQGRLKALGGRDPVAQRRRDWDGKWRIIMFDLPSTDEALRKRLRRFFRENGFGSLQRSVWVTPHDLIHLRKILPRDDQVKTFACIEGRPCGGESDADIVQGSWDWTDINALYTSYMGSITMFPKLRTGRSNTESYLDRLREWAVYLPSCHSQPYSTYACPMKVLFTTKIERVGLAASILFLGGSMLGASEPATPTNPAEPDPSFLSPAESMKRMQVPDGFKVELVAAEPMLNEPAMITWDGNGRMFVLELNTYMQNIDGVGQHEPTSRIKILEDTNNDGTMDKKTVFADGLVLPRFVMPLHDRVLIRETDTGDVFAYFDDSGDGKADRKELAFTMLGRSSGNLEHQDSALTWGIDNWLYSSMSQRRHRLVDDEWITEPVHHEFAQWGLAQDEIGRFFYATAGGERPAFGFQRNPRYGRLNMPGELAEGFSTVYPIVKTPDVQGGPRRVSEHGTLNHFTGHAGQSIFVGHRMPEDLVGNYLLPEPVGRLVRRAKINNIDGKLQLENVYDGKEFIASTDMNFRPLWSATGPDGTIYIVDMYRGIIQEGNWVTPGSYLREQVERLNLQENIGKGRIYRIAHESIERDTTQPRMLEQSPAELIEHLSHPNGWWRLEAQKLIVLSRDRSVAPELESLAVEAEEPLTRVHALWTLDGLGEWNEGLLAEALTDEDPRVRMTAVRIVEASLEEDRARGLEKLAPLTRDPDPSVLAQLINTLRYAGDEGRERIREVMAQHPDNALIQATGEDAL